MTSLGNSGKQISSAPDTLRAALAKSSCSGAGTNSACVKSELPSEVISRDFYGRDFLVTPDTLVPRPETEMMIDAVLNLAGKSYLPGVKPSASQITGDITILDVGTGTGCIAITLKLELPNAKIIAADISAPALAVARENAKRLGSEVKFIKSNLLENVQDIPDLIVANLPYVDKNWSWLDLNRLAREPETALFAEDSGLALIKKLIDTVPATTKYLILEADPCQHDAIIKYAHHLELVETRGFTLVFHQN